MQMPTSIVNRYKSIFKGQEWLSEETFNLEWETWKLSFGDANQSMFVFLEKLLLNAKQALLSGSTGYDINYQKLSSIYFHLWQLHKQFQKDGMAHRREMLYCELKAVDTDPHLRVVTINAIGCCPACEQKDGLTITLGEAMQQQPIPQSVCSCNLGCTCTYGIFTLNKIS